MASGRRGGPPDLKSTLGSLLRTTLERASAVKDVVEQQARARGGVVDQALEQRRRKEALARLGEAVYRMSERGMLGELALDPEIGMALADVESASSADDLDFESMARRPGVEAVSSANYRPSHARSDDEGEYRVWRPVMPEDDHDTEDGDLDTLQDVSPPPTAIAESSEDEAVIEAEGSPTAPIRMTRRSALRGKSGGIQFVKDEPRAGDVDSDDDLEGYMHDDDVPQ